MTDPNVLFSPLQIGNVTIKNRLAMAPMTRQRSYLDGTPTDLNVEYYRQRASSGLIITEGIFPDFMGWGYMFTPGLCTDKHMQGWKRVTDAVHAEGGHIFGQIMHVGRLSDPLILDGKQPIAPSAVQPDPTARHYTIHCPRAKRPYQEPREMTHAEVLETIDGFKRSAVLAQQAGFDGVEIHAASGYLPHQFLSPNSNTREDQWGGSVEKRCAFLLACVDAMVEATSPGFVAVKFSPGWTFHDVFDDNPQATFSYAVKELSKRGIAFLELGNYGMDWDVYGLLRQLFDGPVCFVAGFTRSRAADTIAAGAADFIAFGQNFISNPDLAERYQNDWGLSPADLSTYYTQGAEGYTDYPFHADCDPDMLVPVDSPPTPLMDTNK
ncbi:MAG: alkene reductase [Pseudomonadota bacterium]